MKCNLTKTCPIKTCGHHGQHEHTDLCEKECKQFNPPGMCKESGKKSKAKQGKAE